MGKRRGRALAFGLAVVLATAILGGCTDKGTTGTSGDEPYRIGAVLSLTGTYAGLGIPEENAIKLEVDRINAAGGINGHKLEVFIEDDATDPAKAVAAVARLIEQEDVVAIIGATGTGQTMGIRDEIDRAGIPQVSMAGGSVVTDDFDPLVFQTPWPNRVVVPFTLEALKSRGLLKIGVISDSSGYGKDGHDLIVKDVAAAGIQIVEDQTFNPGDTDMTPQLTLIRSGAPDAILMWNAGKEAAIIARNMRQLGMTMPLIGSPGNGRKEFIDGAGETAEGFRFAAGRILVPEAYGTDSPAFTVATDFINRYTAKYDTAPDIFAGHAYDALLVVTDALNRVDGDVTPATLRDTIEKTSGLVGIGGTFTYSPKDHNGLTADELVFLRVEGSTWVLDQ